MWQFDLVKLESSDFNKWDAWVMSRKHGSVFHTTLWLQSMSQKEVTVVAALGDYNKIIGGFAFVPEQKWGINRLLPPAYTPFFGPVVPEDPSIQAGFVKELKDFLSNEYDALRWRNFDVSTATITTAVADKTEKAITMRRKDVFDEEAILSSYSRSARNKINQAKKAKLSVAPIPKEEIDMVLPLVRASLENNGAKLPLSEAHFLNAFSNLMDVELCFALGVYDSQQNLLNAAIYAEDLWNVYNLVIGTPKHKDYPQAGYLLQHAAILEAAKRQKGFDFEGSSIKGVRKFYDRFKGQEIVLERHMLALGSKAKVLNGFAKIVGKNLY